VGEGSKGAFAGGVAQYLMEVEKTGIWHSSRHLYGSLLIPQLALNKIGKLYDIYTNVNQRSIFSLNPFIVRKKGDREYVSINFLTTFLQFIKSKRTFGESKALRRTIRKNFTVKEFQKIKESHKDVVVTVSNLLKTG